MKVKAAKSSKGLDDKLVAIKKTEKDIKKSKEFKKKDVKAATVKAAANSVAVPLTFAEKKVLSVKRKTKASKSKIGIKSTTNGDSLVEPNGVKETDAATTEPASAKPTKTKTSSELPPVSEETPKKKKHETKIYRQKGLKKNIKGNMQHKPKKPREVGPVATEVSEETAALVPEQLVDPENFRLFYQFVKNKTESEAEKSLFTDDTKYALQINSVKIPQFPCRNARVTLPHSIVREEDDACLIVCDLQRGRKFDYQETINHWEDKLSKLGVTGVTVIPLQQLKRDYREYEMRLKLVNRFGRFMADGRIVGHVFAFLGKIFIVRRKNPVPVRLEKESQIKDSIEKALRTETYHLTASGTQTEIKFAASWMPEDVAVENGLALIEKLKEIFPGGWLNIQNIYLTSSSSHKCSFPLYFSNINPNEIPVPKKVGPREAFIAKQNEKMRKATGGRFEITADGLLKRVRRAPAMELDEPKTTIEAENDEEKDKDEQIDDKPTMNDDEYSEEEEDDTDEDEDE